MHTNRGLNYGMSSESYRTYHTLHLAATTILAASLVLLPWVGVGPNTWRTCSPTSTTTDMAQAPTQQTAAVAPAPVIPPPMTNVEIPAPAPAPEPIPQVAPRVASVRAPAATPAPASTPEPEAPTAPVVDESDLPSAHVYFDVNQSDLPVTGASTIAPIAEYLNDNPSAKVWATGFHDGKGNRANNEKVARKRAISVRDELQKAGIAPGRIILGKAQQAEDGSSQNEARRVELTIQP